MSDKEEPCRYFVLEGKTLKPATLMEWAKWFEDGDGRLIARSSHKGARVTTVCLGHCDLPDEGPFGTLVVGVELEGGDGGEWRYQTYDEAVAGHQARLAMIKEKLGP